jgi:hypothetical protein
METVTYIYQKTKVDNYETLGKIARLPNRVDGPASLS